MKLSTVISEAEVQLNAEVAGVLKNKVIVKRYRPVFEEKPYVVSKFSEINSKISFHSSVYDLKFGEAVKELNKGVYE